MNRIRTRALFLLLSSAVTAIPFALMKVYYMVPDDYLLNYIANGSYGFEDSERLVFVTTPVGFLLKLLYRITTSVNWYAVLLAAVLALSFAVFYSLVYERTGFWPALLPVAGMQVMIVPKLFTFTVVAFLVTAAGAVLWLTYLLDEERGVSEAVFGSVLLVLGYAIRPGSFLPGFAMAAPALLLAFIRRAARSGGAAGGEGKRHFFAAGFASAVRRILTPLAVFILCFGAVYVTEKVSYSSKEWSDFMDYTSVRSQTVDNAPLNYKAYGKELEAAGLTETDYQMLVFWRFCEKDVFNYEALKEAGRIRREAFTDNDRRAYFYNALQRYHLFLFLLPVILLAALILLYAGCPVLSGILGIALYAATLLVLILVRMRFVMRVAIPLTMCACVVLLVLPERKRRRRGAGCVALGNALIAAFLISGGLFLRTYLPTNEVPRYSTEEPPKNAIVSAIEETPETLYIMDAGILTVLYYFGTPVTDVRTTKRFENVVRSGSWDSFSPRYYRQVSRLIPDPDHLLTSLVTEENVAFVATQEKGVMDFLKERLGGKITISDRGFDGLESRIIRYRRAKQP